MKSLLIIIICVACALLVMCEGCCDIRPYPPIQNAGRTLERNYCYTHHNWLKLGEECPRSDDE